MNRTHRGRHFTQYATRCELETVISWRKIESLCTVPREISTAAFLSALRAEVRESDGKSRSRWRLTRPGRGRVEAGMGGGGGGGDSYRGPADHTPPPPTCIPSVDSFKSPSAHLPNILPRYHFVLTVQTTRSKSGVKTLDWVLCVLKWLLTFLKKEIERIELFSREHGVNPEWLHKTRTKYEVSCYCSRNPLSFSLKKNFYLQVKLIISY